LGLKVVDVVELEKEVDTAVAPNLARPLAFAENYVYATPFKVKLKPMLLTTEAPSSDPLPINDVAPDIGSKVAPVPVEKLYRFKF